MRNRILLLALLGPLCFGAEDKVISPKPKTRVRLSGVSVGAGYTHYAGPYYGNPYWSNYWSGYPPMFFPSFHPGFYNGFAQGPRMGEVRLRTGQVKAEVYLNGAYAGLATDLRSMWLEPGAYDLQVKSEGREQFTRRIYVLSGKTLRIDAQEARP